jgi:hypothetical protein
VKFESGIIEQFAGLATSSQSYVQLQGGIGGTNGTGAGAGAGAGIGAGKGSGSGEGTGTGLALALAAASLISCARFSAFSAACLANPLAKISASGGALPAPYKTTPLSLAPVDKETESLISVVAAALAASQIAYQLKAGENASSFAIMPAMLL